MPYSRLSDGATWRTPTDFYVNDGGLWRKAKTIYVNEEYYVDGDPLPRYRWTKFWWSAPTETPGNPVAEALSSYRVSCSVTAYAYPEYNIHWQLYRSTGDFITDYRTADGENLHTFTLSSAYEGVQVYFRARYEDNGKYGPDAYSNSVFVTGGFG